MGMKEKMMDSMMDGMSADEKKEMMDKMMERFFSEMTEEEKRGMMTGMMQKMMGGKDGNSAGMNSMDMCRKMMGSFQETAASAKFATPEVRSLFEEWANQIEEEILSFIQTEKEISPEKISGQFKLSKDSVLYFLKRLADKGKVRFDI